MNTVLSLLRFRLRSWTRKPAVLTESWADKAYFALSHAVGDNPIYGTAGANEGLRVLKDEDADGYRIMVSLSVRRNREDAAHIPKWVPVLELVVRRKWYGDYFITFTQAGVIHEHIVERPFEQFLEAACRYVRGYTPPPECEMKAA